MALLVRPKVTGAEAHRVLLDPLHPTSSLEMYSVELFRVWLAKSIVEI